MKYIDFVTPEERLELTGDECIALHNKRLHASRSPEFLAEQEALTKHVKRLAELLHDGKLLTHTNVLELVGRSDEAKEARKAFEREKEEEAKKALEIEKEAEEKALEREEQEPAQNNIADMKQLKREKQIRLRAITDCVMTLGGLSWVGIFIWLCYETYLIGLK